MIKIEGEATPVVIHLPEDLFQYIYRGAKEQQIPTTDIMMFLFSQGYGGLRLDEEKGERLYLDIGDQRNVFKFPERFLEGDTQIHGLFRRTSMPIASFSSYIGIEIAFTNKRLNELMSVAQRRYLTVQGLITESIYAGLFIHHTLTTVLSQTSEPINLVSFKDGKEVVYPIQPQV